MRRPKNRSSLCSDRTLAEVDAARLRAAVGGNTVEPATPEVDSDPLTPLAHQVYDRICSQLQLEQERKGGF